MNDTGSTNSRCACDIWHGTHRNSQNAYQAGIFRKFQEEFPLSLFRNRREFCQDRKINIYIFFVLFPSSDKVPAKIKLQCIQNIGISHNIVKILKKSKF